MWRYDYSGTLKYHFELISVVVFYVSYFIFNDYNNSRKNQLALYFDEAFMNGENLNFETEFAEKT
jgi:hypothetical protein